ncbi:MAG TPA: ABC transporter permease, partial [Thermoanaerobaculia bacterium]|nr:ABC transporter permease [Thermoanaerobaculia bacterium]
MRSEERAPRWLVAAALGVLAFLYVPMLVMMLYAFTTEEATLSFPPPGLTLRWFGEAWGRTDLWRSLSLSLEVAAAATALALVLGTLAALAVARR